MRRRAAARRWTKIRHPALRQVLRQPLLHFFAVGLLLFVAAEYHRAQTSVYRIVEKPERVRQLAARYRMEHGAEPTPAVLGKLVENDIDEEVLYREGLARKLDRDDEIVRRRVVQKMRFLVQDLVAPAEPSEARLQAWYQAHRADYATPATVSFSHIFFADGAQSSEARRRAVAELASLSDAQVRAPERGDSFLDLYDYSSFGQEQARRLFGDTQTSRELFRVPPKRWIGPLRSVYGWHLVRVQSFQRARTLEYSEARDRVRADIMAADQETANSRRLAELKERFIIVREDGTPRP